MIEDKSNFCQQQVGNIISLDYGISSGVFPALDNPFVKEVKIFLGQIAGKGPQIQHKQFQIAQAAIFEAITKETDPATCQFLAEIYQTVVTQLPGASQYQAELISTEIDQAIVTNKTPKIISQAEAVKTFWSDHFNLIGANGVGFGQRGDVSTSLRSYLEATMAALMPEDLKQAKDIEIVRAFMLAGIDASFEAMEKAANNIDQRQRVFRTLLWLMTDSPMTQGLLNREKQGLGGRQEDVYNPLNSYIEARLLGNGLDAFHLEKADGHEAALSALFAYVVAKEEKPSGQQTLAQEWLSGVNDSNLVVPVSEEALTKFAAGFCSALEKLPGILRTDFSGGLYILLSTIRLISPNAYATLLMVDPGARQQVDKSRRKPHKTRLVAAQNAVATLLEEAPETKENTPKAKLSQILYAAFNAGTVLLPKEITELPKDDIWLLSFMTDVLTPDKVNLGIRHSANSAYILTGAGQDGGTRHLLSEEWSDSEKASINSCLAQFFSQALAVIEDPTFYVEGDRKLNKIAALYLLAAGKILENTSGEAEELTQPYRQMIGQLLYRIIYNPNCCDQLQQAARRVLEYNFPYWPLKDQKAVFDEYLKAVEYQPNAWKWIENGGTEIWNLVAIQSNDSLPRVENQSDRRRPMAEHIAKGFLQLLKNYSDMAGRSERPKRSLIELTLKMTPGNPGKFEELTTFTPQIIENLDFPFRLLDQIAYICPEQEAKFKEALTTILEADDLTLAERIQAPPRPTREFLNYLGDLYQRASLALLEVQQRFGQAVLTIGGMNQSLITRDGEGNLIIPQAPTLTTQLVNDSTDILSQLEKAANLPEVQTGVQTIIEETLDIKPNSAVALAKEILELTKDTSETGLDPKTILQALTVSLGLPQDEEGNLVDFQQTLPRSLVWLTPGDQAFAWMGSLLATHASAQHSTVEAIGDWLTQVFGDKQATQLLIRGLVEQTGLTQRVGQEENLKMQALQQAAALLQDKATTQGLVLSLRREMQQRQISQIQEVEILKTAFEEAKTRLVGADQAKIISQMDIEMRLINAQVRVAGDAATTILAEFETTVPDLARDLGNIAAIAFTNIFSHAASLAKWLNEIGNPNGKMGLIRNAIEDVWRQRGLPLILRSPTAEVLLGRRGAEAAAMLSSGDTVEELEGEISEE
ncbi:hypothetical protein KKD62_00310 [Patescibacteria group bacterium]|nr:hypothetical protein [Patescibacteria group bacterium]MBU1931800.1 hypothetical protein [Patescibacteria group bacterium]